MKTKFLILAGWMIAMVIGSCQNDDRYANRNREGGGNQRTDEEVRDRTDMDTEETADMEWQAFKRESEERIRESENQLEDFRRQMERADEQFRKRNRARVDSLEKQHEDLKRRMREYRYEGRDRWQEFKREFNHDMDQLGNALGDLVRDNKK